MPSERFITKGYSGESERIVSGARTRYSKHRDVVHDMSPFEQNKIGIRVGFGEGSPPPTNQRKILSVSAKPKKPKGKK